MMGRSNADDEKSAVASASSFELIEPPSHLGESQATAKQRWGGSLKQAVSSGLVPPVPNKPSVAQLVTAQIRREEESVKVSLARQLQCAKPKVSTWQCLTWTTSWLWQKKRRDVGLIAVMLVYSSGWAVLETYLVTWMVDELSPDDESGAFDVGSGFGTVATGLGTVAVYGSCLLLGNVLELQVEYLIAYHQPLVKNAMKVAVTTHLANTPQEMLDAAKEAHFKAVLLIEISKLQANIVALIKVPARGSSHIRRPISC